MSGTIALIGPLESPSAPQLTAAAINTAVNAALATKQPLIMTGNATVDFGATPTDFLTVTVTDPLVSAASVITPVVLIQATANNSIDDARHAAMSFRMSTEPAAGSFVLNIFCLFDLASGQFAILYTH